METSAPPPALEPIWSHYLGWLHYAVPGMLARSNIDAMSYAVKHLPSATAMVEIGSFCGLSTSVLTYLKERHGISAPLFTSDRWGFEGQVLGQSLDETTTLTHDDYKRFVRESFLRNATMFCRSSLPHTIESDSDTFFDWWRSARVVDDVFGRRTRLGGKIGFCYIDGNHSYAFAKRDFENTDVFLCAGGFILFDDSGDGSGWEVCKVVEEVLASGRYELIAKNPNYLFRKK